MSHGPRLHLDDKVPAPDYPNPPSGHTLRGKLLTQAIELTEGSRNAAYGDPVVNLGLQGRLMDVFFEEFDKNASLAFLDATGVAALRGSIAQVIGKLARIGAGDVTRLDNYIDGAAYFAIAGEAVDRRPAPRASAAR